MIITLCQGVVLRQGVQQTLSSFDYTVIRRRVERGRYIWEVNKVWNQGTTWILLLRVFFVLHAESALACSGP
jgi:hypothetical protein